MPTINQQVPSFKLLPPNGVYVSKIHWKDEVYYGITNIGTKPTVNNTSEKTVETNIFDFNKDVYGEEMVVELLHYHRKETRFSSVEALQAQLFRILNLESSMLLMYCLIDICDLKDYCNKLFFKINY